MHTLHNVQQYLEGIYLLVKGKRYFSPYPTSDVAVSGRFSHTESRRRLGTVRIEKYGSNLQLLYFK